MPLALGALRLAGALARGVLVIAALGKCRAGGTCSSAQGLAPEPTATTCDEGVQAPDASCQSLQQGWLVLKLAGLA